MPQNDDGRFEHDSNAEVLTPQSVIDASEKLTSRAGDKPEAIPFSTWSDEGRQYDKKGGTRKNPFRP